MAACPEAGLEQFLVLGQETARFAGIAGGGSCLPAVFFANIGSHAFVHCHVFGREIVVISVVWVVVFQFSLAGFDRNLGCVALPSQIDSILAKGKADGERVIQLQRQDAFQALRSVVIGIGILHRGGSPEIPFK